MSDTALNKIIQYGTAAERAAFTPDPAAGSQVLYIWYDTDAAPDTYVWNGAAWVQINPDVSDITAIKDAEFATIVDETALLPNSRMLVAGSNITFDDTTPGQLEIAATGAGGITELTGDVTAGPGSGSQAATIANDAVTTAKILNGNVTNAKLANMAQGTIKGRGTAGAGAPEDLTLSDALELASGTTEIRTKRTITFIVDGGGSAIPTGNPRYFRCPWGGTITKWTLLADQAGSVVVDIWKDTYANFPPTDADSITAGNEPELSAANKNEDSTLTGWTTSITAGDVLAFNIDSAATIEWLSLELEVTF